MNGWIGGVLVVVGGFLFTAFSSLVNDEIKGWLQRVPYAILRLAAALLPKPGQRESIYQQEWLPELIYEMGRAESRPITRLFLGTKFATGLLLKARSIGRNIDEVRQVEATNAQVEATNAASEIKAALRSSGKLPVLQVYQTQADMRLSADDIITSLGTEDLGKGQAQGAASHKVRGSYTGLLYPYNRASPDE